MAVSWSELQKVVVIAALEEFGVMSARCERAAARILPPARELDPTSVPRRCLPNMAGSCALNADGSIT